MKTFVAPRLLMAVGCAGWLVACNESSGVSSDSVTVRVDASGGTATLADGTSIDIPAGAVDRAVEIAISRTLDTGTLPADAQAVGSTYLMQPEGMVFAKSAVVTLAFDPERLPLGATSNDVVVITAPADTAVFGDLATELIDATHVRAYTTHFSLFASASISSCRGNGSVGKSCDDLNPCTANDKCVSRGNCAGTPYSCNDSNVCTNDSCNGDGTCGHTNNTASCSDGNACTTGDTCGGGACNPGIPLTCNDSNVCTNDSCAPASGCVFTPNSASCNDGNACTFPDACSGGSCGGTAYSCDDSDSCTDDACDGSGGCTHTPASGCGCPDPSLECASGPNCPGGYICRLDGCCVPSCSNGIWDGNEGDVDCGVYCPTQCAAGQHCWEGSDCQSGVCTNNICADGCSVAACTADPCPAGYVCGFDGCCVPHCFDQVRNGDEGDVDCGGSCAAKCAPGKHCYGFWDCASGVCSGSVCQ